MATAIVTWKLLCIFLTLALSLAIGAMRERHRRTVTAEESQLYFLQQQLRTVLQFTPAFRHRSASTHVVDDTHFAVL